MEVDGQQHQDDHDRLGVAAGAHVHHELQTRAVLSRAAGHVTQHEEQLAQVGAPGDVGQQEIGEQRAVTVGVPRASRRPRRPAPRRVRDHLVVKVSIVFYKISLTDLPCSPRQCASPRRSRPGIPWPQVQSS